MAESVRPSLLQPLLAPVPGELPGGSRARTASWLAGGGVLSLHERFLSWALA